VSARTDLCSAILALLVERGETVATAESLTGGLLCGALVDVPGASGAVLGGIVAYAAQAKVSLLGVDGGLIAVRGTVDAEVAQQMASGVRRRLDATWGVSTTGVAGPDAVDGKPAGTVFIAVSGSSGVRVEALQLDGGRSDVRQATIDAGLSLLLATLEEQSAASGG
jgi:nicotinamide-nucleotide amidase